MKIKIKPNEAWYLYKDSTCVATVISATKHWVKYTVGGYTVGGSIHIFVETFHPERRKK